MGTSVAGWPRRGLHGRNGPGRGREEGKDIAWHEACPRRINMPVALLALRILLVREEPLRHDEVQVILGARHRHREAGSRVCISTVEGFFSNPVYGGNRDMMAWRKIGFPGASPGSGERFVHGAASASVCQFFLIISPTHIIRQQWPRGKTPSAGSSGGHCHVNAGLERTDCIAFAYGQAFISTPPLSAHRHPASRLALVRFALSYRDVEDMLAERGIDVSYETVRRWALKFGTIIARKLRRGRARPDGRWHLDEVFVSVNGKQLYVWRAVDSEGEVLDILVQPRRDRQAALKLMRKLLKEQGIAPATIVTDKLRSYGSALRELGVAWHHDTGRWKNNARGAPPRQTENRRLPTWSSQSCA